LTGSVTAQPEAQEVTDCQVGHGCPWLLGLIEFISRQRDKKAWEERPSTGVARRLQKSFEARYVEWFNMIKVLDA
jgi:hypothetical protein